VHYRRLPYYWVWVGVPEVLLTVQVQVLVPRIYDWDRDRGIVDANLRVSLSVEL